MGKQEDIKAKYQDGILKLSVPKKEQKKVFKYEYYFPFVVGKALSDNEEMTIERHLGEEISVTDKIKFPME